MLERIAHVHTTACKVMEKLSMIQNTFQDFAVESLSDFVEPTITAANIGNKEESL